MLFNRTDSGKIATYLFYDKIILWVEGPEDIQFYTPILRKKKCEVKQAGGNKECEKLSQAIINENCPYVVILDGDYKILKRYKNPHKRVIRLKRYSIENYLFEEIPFVKLCYSYYCAVDKERIGKDFEILINSIKSKLLEIVILDVAHHLSNTGNKIIPNHPNRLFENHNNLVFSARKISELIKNGRYNLNTNKIKNAEKLVIKFLNKSRLVDLLHGHFVFSLLNSLFIKSIKRVKGKNPTIDNNGLRLLMSELIWQYRESNDHNNLKTQIYRAIRDAQKLKTKNNSFK